MLTIYRRHTKACSAKRSQHDKDYWKCQCTIYAEGKLGTRTIRESLHTRFREDAQKRIMEAEASGSWENVLQSAVHKPKVSAAIHSFLADVSRHLSTATLSKYRTLLSRCQSFCRRNSLSFVNQLTTERLRNFQATWPTGPRATNNNLTRLKAFFRFCCENGWLEKNPALALRSLKHLEDTQKLPFTEAEMERILTCAHGDVLTFVLLLRHTGLRISDAVFLHAGAIADGSLKLRTRKSGARVAMPFEPELALRLAQMRANAGGLIFLPSPQPLNVATELWRRRLGKVFTVAGVLHGHPHRFRHTFAVRLLEKGVDIKTVSLLLGHASVTTTEKFYAAWTDKRQKGLSDELRRTWEEDKDKAA